MYNAEIELMKNIALSEDNIILWTLNHMKRQILIEGFCILKCKEIIKHYIIL